VGRVSAGPQLLDGLNDGAIDFGATGEAPPIFAQAAGAPLVYVAHEPLLSGRGYPGSEEQRDQKSRRAQRQEDRPQQARMSHYLLVKALEKAASPTVMSRPSS